MEKKNILMTIIIILVTISIILSLYSIYLNDLNRKSIDEERNNSIERYLILSDTAAVAFKAVRDRFVLIEDKLNITYSEFAKH